MIRLKNLTKDFIQIDDLYKFEEASAPFIDTLASELVDGKFDVVGAISAFDQTCACIAFLRRIKMLQPSIITVMGVVNCHGDRAQGISELCNEIDFVFSGEAETAFPELLDNLKTFSSLPHSRKKERHLRILPSIHHLSFLIRERYKKMNSQVHIGIVGSYGGNNMGDEAILQSIISQIRESFEAEIVVFTRDPQDTVNRHKVEKAVPIGKLARRESEAEIERLDLLIVGGGGILYDADVRDYLREAQIAHNKGIPVMVYAVGAGPLNDPNAQALVRDVLETAAIVTVRDRPSLHILEETGLHREIVVTADPAFLLEPQDVHINFLLQEGIRKGRKLFGISVREPGKAAPDIKEEHYQQLIANAADYMIERYDAHIVFIPMERKTAFDLHQSHAVIAKMVWPQFASVLEAEYTPGQIMTVIKDLDFVLGMRFHFLIFAALMGVPFVPLPYSSKVMGLLEELQLDTPPLANITPGRLIAYIDKAWDKRDEIVENVKKYLPGLKKRSQQNNILLTELLRIIFARSGRNPDLLGK